VNANGSPQSLISLFALTWLCEKRSAWSRLAAQPCRWGRSGCVVRHRAEDTAGTGCADRAEGTAQWAPSDKLSKTYQTFAEKRESSLNCKRRLELIIHHNPAVCRGSTSVKPSYQIKCWIHCLKTEPDLSSLLMQSSWNELRMRISCCSVSTLLISGDSCISY